MLRFSGKMPIISCISGNAFFFEPQGSPGNDIHANINTRIEISNKNAHQVSKLRAKTIIDLAEYEYSE